MRFSLLVVLLMWSVFNSTAQTFNGNGGPIATNGNVTYFTISTTSLGSVPLNASFGVVSVCININHTVDSELEIRLLAPNSTEIMLSFANGGDGDNYTNTCFDDRASVPISAGIAPFNGTFFPHEFMGNVNNGQPAGGYWKLVVRDMVPNNNNGALVNWSITFGPNATTPNSMVSSNLPIVFVDTEGQIIPDDPKISATMKIIDNGPGVRNYVTDQPVFWGNIGIEVRGSSSQSFPKKSYGLETWDATGNDIDTSLLGMPPESDWILNANYTDKSFCRNVMAYQVWQNMGYYGTRYKFVELMLNNQYKGIYIFSEKIKRNKNRVNISKLTTTDVTGDQLTGGYIVKIDKSTGSGGAGWTSPFPPPVHPNGQTIFFQYEYPDVGDIVIQQKNYIKSYITSFETALNGPNFADPTNGYRKYAVENTFFDYFLVNELSKNVDGYRLSTFLHKQRDSKGGKIRMGPVWDYDIAWHNADYCGGDVTSGWAYQFPCSGDYWQVPFWWSRLLEDDTYRSNLKCRWLTLRQGILSNQWFDNYIDSIAGLLNESQGRNFYTWPILGVYVWPNPSPLATTYQEEVNNLKTWMHNRLAWLDLNMPGVCNTVNIEPLAEHTVDFRLYPNPATQFINAEIPVERKSTVAWAVYNQQGQLIRQEKETTVFSGTYRQFIDVSAFLPGMYLLQITLNGSTYSRRFVKL